MKCGCSGVCMKIILLRHGKPDFEKQWVRSAEEAKRALESYAVSRVTSAPSVQCNSLNSKDTFCVTSNLARAMDSAALIGFKQSSALALFNESELPHPDCLYLHLPWKLFLIIYRLLWFFGFRKNVPGKLLDRQRANKASQYLSNLSINNDQVLLVGHGIMNNLICSELEKSGWKVDARNGNGYWSSISMLRQFQEFS